MIEFDIHELHESNSAFREYVERYCVKHEIDAKTALNHAMVQSVAEYYKNANKGKISVEKIDAGCGGAC